MAGPAKKRAVTEKQSKSSSNGSSSESRDPKQCSVKSIPNFDSNRDPSFIKFAAEYTDPRDLKNISDFLGLAGWHTARGLAIPDSLPQRPAKFNEFGKACPIILNTYNLTKTPDTVVHQYDLNYSGDALDYTKRVLIRKIWNSRKVKSELGEPTNLWIFDGNKLAWSGKKLDRVDTRITVDLDDEEGRPTKAGARGNKHTIHLRWTRQVDFIHLKAFLNGQASWSTDCIDTINFMDHVMREWPSQQYTQIW